MTWKQINLVSEDNWNERHRIVASMASPSIQFFHDFGCGKHLTADFLNAKIMYNGYDRFKYHPESILIDLDESSGSSFSHTIKLTDRSITALCFEGVLEYLDNPLNTLKLVLDAFDNPYQVILSTHSIQYQTLATRLRVRLLRTLNPSIVYDKSNVDVFCLCQELFSRGYFMNHWEKTGETNVFSFNSKELSLSQSIS